MSIGSNRSGGMNRGRESVMSGASQGNTGVRASVMSTKFADPSKGAKKDDGRIQVAIRCRPLNGKEKAEASSIIWKFLPQQIIELEDDGSTATGKTHAYDNVFGPDKDTPTLFEEQCKPIVRSALDGYNGTIFAYGQTSSGKTYTLMGNAQTHPGVTILSIDECFDFVAKNTHMEWDTHASYIEIYNESVTDLLQRDARKGKNLKIIEDKALGATVKDLTELAVLNRQHCLDLILDGEKRRTYAATNMNETSSRSHTLFRLRIEGRTGKNKDGCADNMRNVASEFLAMQQKLTADHASLYLVDRATNELFIQAGEITLRLPMSQGIAGAVATTGETINIADAYEDDRFNRSVDLKTGYRTKSILCMPIKDDQCVGVVQFINKMRGGGDAFDKNDEEQVAGLTRRLGPLIASAQRHATTSIMSRLNLVDLAGSERASKTGASGGVLKQAGYINQSLHTLGACIAILSEGKKQHVPFRDSKLTQLLSSSLGGNAKTCLICAVSPASSNRHETISTLQFASRAKQIVNRFQRNCKHDQTELVAVYEAEIAKLKAQLTQGGGMSGGVGGNGRMSVDYTMLAASPDGSQLSAQFREKLDQFETNVAEADVLANKSLGDAGYRIELKPMVASEGGENENPQLVVAVGCLAQGNSSPQSTQTWIPSENWIAEEELYSRLDWLRKQDASGMLLTFGKNGRNAWDSAGSALGSGGRLSTPAGADEDPSVLENVMTREQERKHWQAKNRKLENQLLLLRTYVEHINTEVKRTSQLTKKLHDKKNHLTRSSSGSSI